MDGLYYFECHRLLFTILFLSLKNVFIFADNADSDDMSHLVTFDFYLHCFVKFILKVTSIRNSYTMGCPPVRGDNPRALASGLSYVPVDKHGITILYHLHQCRPCTSRDISS